MGTLEKLQNIPQLVKWLVRRQGLGFQGRPNKLEDTCYSFWV
jgi:geranylgeranyl transferase type-1 subunit beta